MENRALEEAERRAPPLTRTVEESTEGYEGGSAQDASGAQRRSMNARDGGAVRCIRGEAGRVVYTSD